MKDTEDRFEAELAASFRRSAEDIDSVTAARLAAARRRAVGAAGRARLVPWLPALAASAAAVAGVALVWWPARSPSLPPADAEAVEILMQESHEMFEDDPDFYLWLDIVAVEG